MMHLCTLMLLPGVVEHRFSPEGTQDTHSIIFASSFGSHMVLQQAPARANIWGFTNSSKGMYE